MKAVILPTTNTKALAPLTSWIPEFLLPVVNKPVVEHLIELLVRHEVKEMLLILKHMPYETERYFGDGSRWGVRLSYSLTGSYRGLADAIGRMERSKLDGPLLTLPADLVTDLNLSDFIHLPFQEEADACLACPAAATDGAGLQRPAIEELRELDAYPLILTVRAIDSLTRMPDPGGDATTAARPPLEPASVTVYRCFHRAQHIRSTADLLEVNRAALEGDFTSLLIPGKETKPGLWVGRHCRIHPGAELKPPLLIGNHCNIQGSTCLGPGSVIGDQVILDEGAFVQGSLVLPRTYVGAHTEVKESLLGKNWLFRMPRMLPVRLGDDLILGDLDKKTLKVKGGRLLDLALSLFLLILTSPFSIFLLLGHLLFPSKKILASERRLGTFIQWGHGEEVRPVAFDLFAFSIRNRFLRKLPGLINVIRGDLSLVGISTLDEDDFRRLPKEWQEMRVEAPVGLFHPWEAELRGDLEWEEKMVMDGYYAAARSTWGDIAILGKALFATAFGRTASEG